MVIRLLVLLLLAGCSEWSPEGAIACFEDEHCPESLRCSIDEGLCKTAEAPQPDTYTALTLGAHHGCALRTDGEIVCWGRDEWGLLDAPDGPFVALDAGEQHTCAMREDGTISCWGRALEGRLDAPEVGGWSSLAVGGSHACAIDGAGSVHCWGRGTEGQRAVPEGLSAVAVAVGSHLSCALDPAGDGICWGWFAELPWATGPIGGDEIAVGSDYVCWLEEDRHPHCVGGAFSPPSGAPAAPPDVALHGISAGSALACGILDDGLPGCFSTGSGVAINAEALGLERGPYTSLSVGSRAVCALTAEGAIHCWTGGLHGLADPP